MAALARALVDISGASFILSRATWSHDAARVSHFSTRLLPIGFLVGWLVEASMVKIRTGRFTPPLRGRCSWCYRRKCPLDAISSSFSRSAALKSCSVPSGARNVQLWTNTHPFAWQVFTARTQAAYRCSSVLSSFIICNALTIRGCPTPTGRHHSCRSAS